MATITPDTYIKLVRFDVTKQHQITFSNLQAQIDYFDNLQGVELQASTYQRKDWKIRFPACIDDIENYNYLIYRNNGTPNIYQDKTYFCYITNMEYVNDNLTDVTIQIDCFQTYQFDFIYKQMYIEREHVNNDTIGANTIPESLELGNYILNSQDTYIWGIDTDDSLGRSMLYIVQTPQYASYMPSNERTTNLGGVVFSGLTYATDVATNIDEIVEGLNGENVEPYNVYVVPKRITNCHPPLSSTSWKDFQWHGQNGSVTIPYTYTKPTDIDGYTPVNKKLLCYPYNYLIVSNNSGSSINLKFEHFDTDDCEFEIKGIPVPRWFNCDFAIIL